MAAAVLGQSENDRGQNPTGPGVFQEILKNNLKKCYVVARSPTKSDFDFPVIVRNSL